MRRLKGVEPFESDDRDSGRVWWQSAGVHQNLTFPVHPDPISGAHAWHQKVRVTKAEPGDQEGDVVVDTVRSHAVYKEWLAKARPAPGPDGMRTAVLVPAAVAAECRGVPSDAWDLTGWTPPARGVGWCEPSPSSHAPHVHSPLHRHDPAGQRPIGSAPVVRLRPCAVGAPASVHAGSDARSRTVVTRRTRVVGGDDVHREPLPLLNRLARGGRRGVSGTRDRRPRARGAGALAP